jgi:hypothetical protein
MVVDSFLQLVQHGQAMGSGKLGLRLRDRIDGVSGSQRVNGQMALENAFRRSIPG